MGRRGKLTSQEFHDFANVAHAIIWQGVAAVMAARISIAESHRVCEQTRELLAGLRKEAFRRSPGAGLERASAVNSLIRPRTALTSAPPSGVPDALPTLRARPGGASS